MKLTAWIEIRDEKLPPSIVASLEQQIQDLLNTKFNNADVVVEADEDQT